MLATITCPACEHKFSIPEGAMGKHQTCPNCQSPFVAGKSVAAAAAPNKFQPTAAAPINPSSRPPAGVETPSAVGPAAKPWKNWMMVAGAGAGVLLLVAIGMCAGVLVLLNRQPEKKGNEEVSKSSAGLAGAKDDEAKKKEDAPDGDKKAEAKKSRAKTTVDGIEYELVSAKNERGNLEVVISALTPDAGKRVNFSTSRAFTEEGKLFTKTLAKRVGDKLLVDQKIQIELNLGPLPDTVTKLSSVELSGPGILGAGYKNHIIVFKNVTVEQ